MYLDHTLRDPSCRVCLFFEKIASPKHFDSNALVYHLRVFPADGLFEVRKAEARKPQTVALAIHPGSDEMSRWRRGPIDGGLALANCLTHYASRTEENESVLEVSALQAYEVDYGCCTAWIEHCLDKHGCVCSATDASSLFSVPLMAIDCISRVIKPIDNHDRYVALSYVWGAGTSDIPGRLPAMFLRTQVKRFKMRCR